MCVPCQTKWNHQIHLSRNFSNFQVSFLFPFCCWIPFFQQEIWHGGGVLQCTIYTLENYHCWNSICFHILQGKTKTKSCITCLLNNASQNFAVITSVQFPNTFFFFCRLAGWGGGKILTQKSHKGAFTNTTLTNPRQQTPFKYAKLVGPTKFLGLFQKTGLKPKFV